MNATPDPREQPTISLPVAPEPGQAPHPPAPPVPPQAAPPPPQAAPAPLPPAAPAPPPHEPPLPPPQAAPGPPPPGVAPSSNDLCPNCHARMAPDQRYCLNCGNRRGEPRLPFMDAVAFMESMHGPPPGAAAPASTPPPRQRPSSATALLAGVACLILAIGVGVLIGQSGESSAPVAAKQPNITVNAGGGGGGGGAEQGQEQGGGKSGKANAKAAKKDKSTANIETGANGTSKEAEEFLKPDSDVQLAPPDTGVGDPCEKGTAGCGDSGKFEGNFFGE